MHVLHPLHRLEPPQLRVFPAPPQNPSSASLSSPSTELATAGLDIARMDALEPLEHDQGAPGKPPCNPVVLSSPLRRAQAPGLNFSSRNLLDSAAGGTFMSITLGAATKLLDDMMINYSEWHTERTPQASLVVQEENVDVNFIKSNNFNNNAYKNNYGNNNYRPYPSNNGNGCGNSYGNSYNNNKSVPSGLEVMLKEFISTQTAFNKTVEEKLGKIDILDSKVDNLALDVDLLKLKVMPEEVKDARFAKTNAIQNSPEQPQSQAPTRRSSQTIANNWSSPEPRHCTRSFVCLANVASNLASNLRRPTAPSDPLGEYDQEKMVIFDIKLMVGFGCDTIPILKVPPQYPKWMEPYVQTETYDLENGGSLVFERDLYLVSEKLERPPPKFHGVRIHNTPAGEQQWMITADLKGSSEPPISERILFSFKAYSWVDGLAHALQEGLARVCGQNIAALRGSRFAHFARHDTMGEPMALSSHPVLKIHATRQGPQVTRLQRAQNVATITRLREKIRTLEVTVRTQQDQIQEMEEDGEDIQGGDDFLSDDNDFEDDEFTDEEDYEFLESAEDGIIPIDVDEDNEE
ncbi:hypothetical protein QYE76_066347 [Lolium multiflorum]|uniref:Uncharacterized protein n=1 Tax=Lolium multiflorum TaxID=4521 RepID=A0AAD8WC09_LOLMU|nr:hypothetical protein QYE76_066347 [Lolium multiflorum]